MDEKINIKFLIRRLASHWVYFLISLAVIIPCAYLYIDATNEIYRVKASLLIKDDEKRTSPNEGFMRGMDLLSSVTELEDEIGKLSSFSMIEAAIKKLDFGISYFEVKRLKNVELYEDIPFTIELDSSRDQIINTPIFIKRTSEESFVIKAEGEDVAVYDYILKEVKTEIPKLEIAGSGSVKAPFHNDYLTFSLRFNNEYSETDDTQYCFVINDVKEVVDGYRGNLTVAPLSRESNILIVSSRGTTVAKEIVFLNTLLDVYLKNQLDKKNQLGIKTIAFIDRQIGGVYDSLKQVEGSLESFRIRNNILDINTTAQNLTTNLDRLEAEKAKVDVKVKYYTYVAESLNNASDFKDIVAPSTFGLDDPLLSSLLIELSRLSQERSGLNYSTKERNPVTEVIDLKIKNNKKSLLENVNNILDVSRIALTDLNERLLLIRNKLNRLPKNERELVNLERRFKFNDNVYNYLLQKRAEAGIAIASNTPETIIVDRAEMDGKGPIAPNKKLIYAIAVALSIALTIFGVIARDFFNDNITSHEDIERSTKIPFIGSISRGSRRDQKVIVPNSRTAVGESFRSLRVNLQYLTFGKEIQVIGFTSSGESEGKTFCAVNLAASMAQSGRRTVLIDTDMRRPTVAGYFRLRNDKGLSSYLVGGSSIPEIINKTEMHDFDVITSGPLPPNPLDLIGHSRMAELVSFLKKNYHTIIFDSPPIGYVSEYVILMKFTDVNIYVVRYDFTSRYNLIKINKLYEEKKISNISILLNDVKPTKLNGYVNGYVNEARR